MKTFIVAKLALFSILVLLSFSPKHLNINEGDPTVKKCLNKADSMTILINSQIDSMLNEKSNYSSKVNILEFKKSNKK
jgi:hypothetical protein